MADLPEERLSAEQVAGLRHVADGWPYGAWMSAAMRRDIADTIDALRRTVEDLTAERDAERQRGNEWYVNTCRAVEEGDALRAARAADTPRLQAAAEMVALGEEKGSRRDYEFWSAYRRLAALYPQEETR